MRGLGGGTTSVGNTTQDHEAATTGKKVRARNIDAGIQREKVLLLLVFDEGRTMWNEDNKEGNLVML